MNDLEILFLSFPDKNWDYFKLSSNPNLTVNMVESAINKRWYFYEMSQKINLRGAGKLKGYYNYHLLSLNPTLTSDIVLKNFDKPWDLITVSQTCKLFDPKSVLIYLYKNGTWDDIKNLKEINFSLLSTNKNITSDIIELHKDKWIYKWLSRNPHITSDFISKNLDKDWDWEFLAERVEIREEFIPFFRFNTYPSLTINPHLTWEFVKNNLDKNWDYQKLSCNKKIVKDIESTFVFSNKWNFNFLSENESLTFDHLMNNINNDWLWFYLTEKFSLEQIYNTHKVTGVKWSALSLSRRNDLTLEWIDKIEIDWCWKDISSSPSITFEIVKNNPNRPWDMYYFSQNPNVTAKLIENNWNFLWNFEGLSENINIDISFIKNHPNKNWCYLSIVYIHDDIESLVKLVSDVSEKLSPKEKQEIWEVLSENENLSWETVYYHRDKLWNWGSISKNKFCKKKKKYAKKILEKDNKLYKDIVYSIIKYI